MASEKKQEFEYGLIIPNKRRVIGPARLPKPSVFADESSSDEEGENIVRGKYGSSVWRANKKNSERLETHGSVVKALSEDPSVFEYDSLYDKMQDDKRKSDPRLQRKDTKPKYISQLKKVAEKRKLEQELIYERKVQRDMEKEGLDAEDTEAYHTSAYRKKLEERKAMEEELRKEEEIEKANDVTKQKDMTRFHKHLFDKIASGPSGVNKQKSSPQKSPDKTTPRQRRDSDNRDAHDRKDRRRDSREGERQRERKTSSQSEERRRSLESGGRRHSSHSDGRRQSNERRISSQSDNNEASPLKDASKDDENTSIVGEDRTRTDSVSSVDNVKSPSNEVVVPKEVDKEERRKVASAKRTNEEAQLSARDRYLARKKVKLAVSTGQQ